MQPPTATNRERPTKKERAQRSRAAILASAQEHFARSGFAGATVRAIAQDADIDPSMVMRYFGDKRGLFAAVVEQIDTEMAGRAKRHAAAAGEGWDALLAEGAAYIEMALDPEVQRIVLLDGPAVLGDPSQWPSQNSCLQVTREAIGALMGQGVLKPVDAEAAARLISGAALNAAMWIAASAEPEKVLPKAQEAFRALVEGLLAR